MRVVVIGGGPAGILAAIAAAKSNISIQEKVKEPSQVLLIEKNEKLGKKLFISGKGRCNLTNNCSKDEFLNNIVRNPKFFYSAFSEFSNSDLKKMIEDNGCPLKVERGNRVFPISDKSYDVIDALKKALKDAGVRIKLNTEVKSVSLTNENKSKYSDVSLQNENVFIVSTNKNENIIADKLIIATGGRSYPSTGSTGDGYKFAKNFSLNVIDQKPSLVPFNVKEINECKSMQGLSLKNVGIKIYDINNPKKILYKDFGELMFTHFGVSGPIILSASCYLDNLADMTLSIDLKPALSEDKLEARVLKEFEENKNKNLKSVLKNMLPSSMISVFLNRLEDIKDIKVSEIDKSSRKIVIKLFKDFRLTLLSKRGFDEAVVTRGGIDVKEINPKTMESKKIKGLFFAGEVLDIDAMTGGFNIQIACSTGYTAGKNVNAV